MIGKMDVSKSGRPGFEHLISRVNMTISVLVSIEVECNYEAIFNNHRLHKSYTSYIRSGNMQNESVGYRTTAGYHTDINGEGKNLDDQNIDYSLLWLYYREPVGMTRVYSEPFGDYLALRSLGNHRYELTQASGRKTMYQYHNGRCTEVSVQHTFATIYFRLQGTEGSLLTEH